MPLGVSQEGFCQLWAEWEALLAQSVSPAVFQTPLWHRTWWEEMGGGAELKLTSLREDGVLVGVAPLMHQNGTLTFMGDTDLWDYHDFVLAKGREADLYPRLFESLLEQPWELMDLRSLPEGSFALQYIPQLARARSYSTEQTPEDVSPGVALPGSWDDYLLLLSKKNRHELRRKLRRLESQASYRLYAVNGTSALDGALNDFLTLMRDSRQDKAVFLTPDRERFIRRMGRELAKVDIFRLFFIEVSGHRVASAICFDYGQTRSLYNSGYNPEYGSLSVGLLLKALCLRQAIEEGKRYFDFLRGDEPYKYDLGGKDVQLYRLTIRR